MNRWTILAVLFLARMAMAFQFQAIAALSPLLMDEMSLDLAAIGLLIGLYLAPGVLVAIPGGAIASRFGDKRVVALGMVFMLLGALLASIAPSEGALLVGRIVAGTGGVILNIVMTKMLVDWFTGREISTAMAIFVNSWPVGIALALLVLPRLAHVGGLAWAWWSVTGLIALTLALFAAFYRPPEGLSQAPGKIQFAKMPFYGLVLAGMVWALYNTALAMVFSFGPALLVQKGWSVPSAGTQISAFMIVFSLALPIGGLLADRTGRRDAIITISLLSFVVLMPLALVASSWVVGALLLIVGVLFALAAGPIMTLPSAVLEPSARAFGMGVFFTIYYVVMMIGPRIGGQLADSTGTIGSVILMGAAFCAASLLALALFRSQKPVR